MGVGKTLFPLVHPSPTGGRRTFRGKDLPDSKGVKGNESRFVRCYQCGMICDLERDARGDGQGYTVATSSYTISGITHYYGEVSVQSGCPACGSRNYLGL